MKYNELASETSLQKVVTGLQSKAYQVIVVKNKIEALEKIKEIIPAGVTVMNGASVTLEQIGFVDYLKSANHGWNNLHAAIVSETNPQKQNQLRQQAIYADYYLGSVHALAESGEFIIASNSGSQLPHIVFTSPHLIFVVSTKKIVPNLTEAMTRLTEYVLPLEDVHMQEKYHVNTQLNKIVIFKGENQMMGRKVTFLLIEADVGF